MSTPSQYIEETQKLIDEWHVPLYTSQTTIDEGLRSMDSFKLQAEDVPFIIKLVENPKYDIGLFADRPKFLLACFKSDNVSMHATTGINNNIRFVFPPTFNPHDPEMCCLQVFPELPTRVNLLVNILSVLILPQRTLF